MRILACYSIKGGVGKTASAVNLAWLAAQSGLRTVLWDLDPQGAASFYLRVKPKVKGGVDRLLERRDSLDDIVRKTDYKKLRLIPADFSYRHMDHQLHDEKKPVKQLMKLIRPLSRKYDLLILDAPPSISMVSENIFYASDALLVPVIPTTLSMRTWKQLNGHFEKHPKLRAPLLPFFSMVDRRKRIHLNLMAGLRAGDERVLNTAIPYSSVVEKMGEYRAPVPVFAPSHPVAAHYRGLWQEVAGRLRLLEPVGLT